MSSNLNTINKHRQTQMLELGGWNPPSSDVDEVVTSHMRAWEPCHAHVPHWSWCEHGESGRPAGVGKENIVGNISMCDVFCSSHQHEMLLWTQNLGLLAGRWFNISAAPLDPINSINTLHLALRTFEPSIELGNVPVTAWAGQYCCPSLFRRQTQILRISDSQ